MANRLWQHHFGKGLSASSSNFGVMGFEPADSQLLDWLAVEFATDWSLKRMHRLLVTSAAYRMASQPTSSRWNDAENQLAKKRWQDAVTLDPENQLIAVRRLFRHGFGHGHGFLIFGEELGLLVERAKPGIDRS